MQRMEAAFQRAAHKAVHGTRKERSGRFFLPGFASASHDAASGDLEVRFNNDRIYLYSKVPRHVYEALQATRSREAFFNAFIRDHYSCREL
jgi:hypothetical protein